MIKNIGTLEFYSHDLGKKITIHDYLIELLKTLWCEQDEFSGKRPFGNSGWDYDIMVCLIENHIIEGELNMYGEIVVGDTAKGYDLIQEYIESLRGGEANSPFLIIKETRVDISEDVRRAVKSGRVILTPNMEPSVEVIPNAETIINDFKTALLKKIFPYDVVDRKQYSINAYAVEKAIEEVAKQMTRG